MNISNATLKIQKPFFQWLTFTSQKFLRPSFLEHMFREHKPWKKRPQQKARHPGVFCLALAAFLFAVPPLALSIPLQPLNDQAKSRDQITQVQLAGRANAKSFSNINRLLNSRQYNRAIENANAVLKKHPNSGLANEILGTAHFLNGQRQKAITFLKKANRLAPSQSGPLTKLGIINMEDGNLIKAENQLLQAIKINPGARFAHQRLGLLYAYQKKNTEAIRHFSLGLKGTPNRYIGVAVNLGHLLNKSGNYKATVAVLEARLPEKNPMVEAHLILATAYLATGKYAKAHSRFKRVLQLNPTIPEASLGLAKAQRGEGKYLDAQQTINQLLNELPNSANARMEEGEIYLRLNKETFANTAFDTAEVLGVKRPYINLRKAKFYLDRKDFSRARDIYQGMVSKGTADAFVYGQLSELLLSQGQSQGDTLKGEQMLKSGIKRFPNNAYLHLRHGSYLASLGEYKKSLPILKKSTQLLSNDPVIWKTYMLALARAGQTTESVKAAKRLYELQPNTIEVAVSYATQLDANNQLKEAEVMYRKIIKAVPDHALALNNLANVLARKNNYPEAEKMAKRAVKSVSNNGNLQDTLGWILYKQGRIDEALAALQRATKLAPKVAIIWYHKGVALNKTGRTSEAKSAIEKALSMNSTADWVGDAKVLSQQL
ncbi:MAG: tetratricopeptide repeat protein [Ectothiorhodospiraceae bacterium]|nr:tetratricopeptide repeat protein [Ectothiorhodospiraceae bacterium]